MDAYVPLFQTPSWVFVVIVLIIYFKPQVAVLIDAVTRRLESGSSVKIGPVEIGELKEQVASVRKDLDDMNEKVSRLFLTTMSPAMYTNLKKLRGGHFGQYEKTKGLERELYHLRDIGYVEIDSITSIPNNGPNLSDHVKITDQGRSFVALRESIERETLDA